MAFIKREYQTSPELLRQESEIRSIAEEVINSGIQRAIKKQEEAIIAAFAKKGYVFDSEQERNDFFKKNVTAVTLPNDELKYLYVGDRHICSYGELTSIEPDIYSSDYRINGTIEFKFIEGD